MNGPIAERDTLYYPYVHFPSDDWLKATLLFAPHVYRMVAQGYRPRWDTPFMAELREIETNGIHLVEHADLWSPTAEAAQDLFVRRIKEDIQREGQQFTRRFDKAAARAVAEGPYGFQMHPGKLSGHVAHELRQLELAWTPDDPEDNDYLELHPSIGAAVLGGIAVACAADNGLAVIGDAGDRASRELNQLAPAADYGSVYDRFVRGVQDRPRPQGGSAEAAVDILVFQHCDVSKLKADDLVDLSNEREPIRKLKARLAELAAEIPPMLDEGLRERRLKEAVRAALEEWKNDRPNFRGALRRFFGAELAAAGVELAKGSLDKAADVSEKAGEAGSAITAGVVTSHFLGPIGGFAIAVVVHGVSSALGELAKTRKSPYRYLSLAEKAGVVFSAGGIASAADVA